MHDGKADGSREENRTGLDKTIGERIAAVSNSSKCVDKLLIHLIRIAAADRKANGQLSNSVVHRLSNPGLQAN